MISKQYINYVDFIKEEVRGRNYYPYNIPAVQQAERIELHPDVTFFVGENGSGKSTLIEALAVKYGFNAEGGSKHFNFSTQSTESPLSYALRIGKGIIRPMDGFFLRAESFYNVASYLDRMQREDKRALNSYGNKSLHEQSHGESFFSLFMHRFEGEGVYILDEPEAALSPQRQLAFLVRLHELVNKQSQFIIATHSPILLSYPNAAILELSESGVKKVKYADTEQYSIYRAFINNPKNMIKNLGIE